MDFIVIGLVAFTASALTFFSGFGLGTLLLPAFAIFFSAPIALTATGIVHLLNNLFKGTLVRKNVDWRTVLRFGLPAVPAAILGAYLLTYLDTRIASIVIGVILIAFAVLEFQPWFQRLTFPKKYLSLGGVATGFLGGLSGQQGALRSMFLLKSDFEAVKYIATGVFIAILIDLARLPTYLLGLKNVASITQHEIALIEFGTFCAFIGAWLGAKYVKKTTIGFIRYIVAGLMLCVGTALIVGLIGG
ncbi:MAG: hypothetical protein ABA06_01145 [Parcubacteria bacterium C7867-001]|nr:MAG: hypothetical protein ABA06_01145 [Parcubacteria bacterium C7867-001]